MESIFQRENCVVAQAITNKLSPPEDLPTSYASVSSFLQGYCWSNATLYSLIYLIMVMTKVCLPTLGGGTLAKYLSCVIKEASLERIRDVLKWGNNEVFKEQMGEDWIEQKHCSLTSTALKQWNKAKQWGGIINSLWWIAGVYLFLVWPNI